MKKNELQLNHQLLLNDPQLIWDHFIDALDPIVTDIYHNLSKSGHFSHDQSKKIVKQFFNDIKYEKALAQDSDQFNIIAMTILVQLLMDKANNYDSYRFRQNRFLAFFNELLQQGYPALKREANKATSPFYEWYTSVLLKRLTATNIEAPYEKLAATWLLCEERDQILVQHAKRLLAISDSYFFKKLASLLYLQANDGAKSLSLLKKMETSLHPSELIDHFNIILKKRNFEMMKSWFDYFFSFEKPKQGTPLSKLYEEMLIETGSAEEKVTIVWKNWLEQPSFQTYQAKIKKSNENEKQIILNYILPKLQADLFRPKTEATYYQIVAKEQLFHLGIESLLTYKSEVSPLSLEIEMFLEILMKKQPQLLLPFYHQVVERLVQKKSRVHYEEAVYYIKKLKIIYDTIELQNRFEIYKMGLNQRFKTFRAFIQELKKID